MNLQNKKNALIIGNGRSRLSFPVKEWIPYYTTFGCNAVHRDMYCNFLIAPDRKMCEEIVKAKKIAYTRLQWYKEYKDFLALPTLDNFILDAGESAAYLAYLKDYTNIFLVGFDFYQTIDDGYNSVYRDTPNYPIKNTIDTSPLALQGWIKLFSLSEYVTWTFIGVKPIRELLNHKVNFIWTQ